MSSQRGLSQKEIKDVLFKWINGILSNYPTIGSVNNFGKDWQNGMAFCALLHHYKPEFVNLNSLNPQNYEQNLDTAFKGFKQMGVAQLIDAEDIAVLPEPKAIMTYVLTLNSKLAGRKTPGSPSNDFVVKNGVHSSPRDLPTLPQSNISSIDTVEHAPLHSFNKPIPNNKRRPTSVRELSSSNSKQEDPRLHVPVEKPEVIESSVKKTILGPKTPFGDFDPSIHPLLNKAKGKEMADDSTAKELEELKSAFVSLKDELKTEKKSHGELKACYEERIATLNNEKELLNRKLSDFEETSVNLKQEMQSDKSQVISLREQLTKVKEELEEKKSLTVSYLNQIKDSQAQAATLNSDYTMLKQQYDTLCSEQEKMKTGQDEKHNEQSQVVIALQDNNLLLKSEVNDLKAQIEAMASEAKVSLKLIEDMKTENQLLNETRASLETKSKALEDENILLSTSRTSLEAKLKTHEDEHLRIIEDLKSALRNAEVKEKYINDQLISEREMFKVESDKLKESVKKANSQTTSDSRVSDLEQDMMSLREELISLRSSSKLVEQLQDTCNILKSELNSSIQSSGQATKEVRGLIETITERIVAVECSIEKASLGVESNKDTIKGVKEIASSSVCEITLLKSQLQSHIENSKTEKFDESKRVLELDSKISDKFKDQIVQIGDSVAKDIDSMKSEIYTTIENRFLAFLEGQDILNLINRTVIKELEPLQKIQKDIISIKQESEVKLKEIETGREEEIRRVEEMRILEEQRIKEEAERKRLEEQHDKEEAERKRLEEQRAKEEAERKRLEEQHVKEEAERKRLEEQRVKEEAERKRLEEQRVKEEAERKRLEEQRAKEEAERKRLEEQRVKEEAERKRLEEQRIKEEAERKRLEEQRIKEEAERKRFEDQKNASQRSAESKMSEEERLRKETESLLQSTPKPTHKKVSIFDDDDDDLFLTTRKEEPKSKVSSSLFDDLFESSTPITPKKKPSLDSLFDDDPNDFFQ